MTASEERKIDKLRMELSEYHVEVREHIARDEANEDVFQTVFVDLYGLPGKKGRHPGLMMDVATLKQSRRWMLVGLRGAWALLLIVGGAVLGKVLKG